jgi:Rap1a immunity proteins
VPGSCVRSVLLLLAFFGTTDFSQAGDQRPSLVQGRTLLAACTSEAPKSVGACEGYIVGAYDILLAFARGCRDGVSPAELRDSVTRALAADPDLRSLPAAFAVALHLTETFGCEVQQN